MPVNLYFNDDADSIEPAIGSVSLCTTDRTFER